MFVSAAGGFATSQTAYNAIQAFTGGGMFANSFTAVRYVQTGTSAGPPTVTLNDQFHPGALYWDTGLAAEQVYNGCGDVAAFEQTACREESRRDLGRAVQAV